MTFRSLLKITTSAMSFTAVVAMAHAADFNVPAGDLKAALDAYAAQSGVALIVSSDEVRGARTKGLKGDFPADTALSHILAGTGFGIFKYSTGAVGISREKSSENISISPFELAQASPPPHSAVETVTVTSSKLGGADVQSIPIAITALSQEQLTATQTAGGPDLVKQVPNLTFTKTNFTGYSIQIRGIGTQAISVTTDPAVAVAMNDIPFIRNHFFEQEFYDVANVEVLRGPQGTLYGRNATAGVVNLASAKPTDQFEAMVSADLGNYQNRRFEGMVNFPIVDDRLDLRIAGEWTKRDGYTYDTSLSQHVDGRDLWSSRVTLGWKPVNDLQVYAVWEHFQENDDRVRSAKQLCKKDPGPDSVDGFAINAANLPLNPGQGNNNGSFDPNFPLDFNARASKAALSQGCLPTSLYSSDAFETPNGQVIPFVFAGEFAFNAFQGPGGYLLKAIDPYANQTQSRDLRVIESLIKPAYKAKNDTLELNADYAITPQFTLTSQTGYNTDFLYSTEDFNRFNTQPGIFNADTKSAVADSLIAPNGIYCDPQLGCSSAMVAEDVSQEHASQFSQEVRLASHFDGPLNFSVGGNYMYYQTTEDYYVLFNLLTALTQLTDGQGAGEFTECNTGYAAHGGSLSPYPLPISSAPTFINLGHGKSALTSAIGCVQIQFDGRAGGTYIDPNPLSQMNGLGHNYFRSENPYQLDSYAGFGEVYYQLTPDLKLTGGLRWTDDQKTFWNIPSWVFEDGGGYPVMGVVNQEWKKWTGRVVANWTPKLDFTDQTLIYASYARGYKGGGANPPGPISDALFSAQSSVTHPATFAPEFINAYELGTKNTLLDGGLTLNADVFYYDYKGYQISQIVDRTSINLNFDAKVKGAELEATYEPIPGLRFNFAGGYEDTRVNDGQSAIDLMDRTAGHSDWMVVRPYITETSNCILPAAAVAQILQIGEYPVGAFDDGLKAACDAAYLPASTQIFFSDFSADQGAFATVGFDPSTAPNNGEGFAKDLGGNKLPNSPPFTLSVGSQYTIPLSPDWAGTLHGDFYWQGNSFARIFNDKPYDQLKGYTNLNLTLIFTNQEGWQAMAYVKNVFDTTAITGAFLNSDDTALTTNVFVTDPRLFGVRITKNW